MAKDSILFCDTSFTAQALVKLYLDLYEKHAEGILNTSVQLEDVVSTIELLVSDLQECSRLLSIAPQFEKQQVRFLHFERFHNQAQWASRVNTNDVLRKGQSHNFSIYFITLLTSCGRKRRMHVN